MRAGRDAEGMRGEVWRERWYAGVCGVCHEFASPSSPTSNILPPPNGTRQCRVEPTDYEFVKPLVSQSRLIASLVERLNLSSETCSFCICRDITKFIRLLRSLCDVDEGVDNCWHRSRSRFIRRHEAIKNIIGRALKTLPASRVEFEPAIDGRAGSFDDIRYQRLPSSGPPNAGFLCRQSTFYSERLHDLDRLDKIVTRGSDSPLHAVFRVAIQTSPLKLRRLRSSADRA